MKKNYLLLLLLLFLFQVALSQQIRFDRFDVSNGLSQNNINGLEMDDLGNIWVGTLDGINKYNGYSFEIFKPFSSTRGTLVGNHVITLGKGKDNNMWVITRGGGLNEYTAATNSFRVINSKLFGAFNLEQTSQIQQSSDRLLWMKTRYEVGLWGIDTQQFDVIRGKDQLSGFRVFDSTSILVYGRFGIEKISASSSTSNRLKTEVLTTNPCY